MGSYEEYARIEIQQFLQRLLEEEVKAYFGRGRYERQDSEGGEGREVAPKVVVGYRNGYGKPRKLSIPIGTIKVPRPRGFKKTSNATAMLWKLLMVAETKSFRKLNATHLLKEVFLGVKFNDGQSLNLQQPQPLEAIA